jgi:glutaredoxin-like protein
LLPYTWTISQEIIRVDHLFLEESMENPSEAKIIFYGTNWCYSSRRARAFLDQHQIPYTWVDIDKDAEAAKIVEKINKGNRSVPTIVFPDGSILVEPSATQLASKLGK